MLEGADVFIGLSTGGIVGEEMVRSMAPDAIVFALAAGAGDLAHRRARPARRSSPLGAPTSRTPWTSRSSSLGFFRGLLDSRARNIRLRTLLYAAQALADVIHPDELHADYIVPRIFDFRVAPAVAAAVVRAARRPARLVARSHRSWSSAPAASSTRDACSHPNHPPAGSTRRFARRRSTCGYGTAECWRSAPRSRFAITTS